MTARESVALPVSSSVCEQKHTGRDIWTVPDGIEDRMTIVESRRYSRRIARAKFTVETWKDLVDVCMVGDAEPYARSVRVFDGHALPEILHGWKSFSATRATRLLGRSGGFWQREYYDHLVRSEDEFSIESSTILPKIRIERAYATGVGWALI